jgi:hypothetical protein
MLHLLGHLVPEVPADLVVLVLLDFLDSLEDLMDLMVLAGLEDLVAHAALMVQMDRLVLVVLMDLIL